MNHIAIIETSKARFGQDCLTAWTNPFTGNLGAGMMSNGNRPPMSMWQMVREADQQMNGNALATDQQLKRASDDVQPASQPRLGSMAAESEHLGVLEPTELREQIATTAKRRAALYEKTKYRIVPNSVDAFGRQLLAGGCLSNLNATEAFICFGLC